MPLPMTWIRSSAPCHQRASSSPSSEGGDVVGERVEPDVDDLRRIVRHRDPPSVGAFDRTRHADVVQSRTQLCEHLVATRRGLDAERAALDRTGDPFAVARQPEEPVPLPHDVGRRAVLRATTAGVELVVVEEGLTTDAVRALVVPQVQVPWSAHARHRRSTPCRWRGSVAVRITSSMSTDSGSSRATNSSPLARTKSATATPAASAARTFFRRVVVGAGLRADLVAAGPPGARERIDLHELERVPDVRLAVDVRDRGGEIDAARDRRIRSLCVAHVRCSFERGPEWEHQRMSADPSRDPTVVTRQRRRRPACPVDGAHHPASLRTKTDDMFAGHGVNIPIAAYRPALISGAAPAETRPRRRGSPNGAWRSSTPPSRCRGGAHPTDPEGPPASSTMTTTAA